MRESYPIIKKNHLLISLLCFTLLIFDSCNNPEEVKPVAGAQQWFNKTLGMQWDAWPNKAKIQSIDWDNAITHGTTIEVPVRLEEKIAGQYYNGKESSKNEIAMRLVLWQESEEYHAIVLEILQQGGNMPIHLGDIEKSRFSGLMVANLGGGKQYATIIDKGNSQQKKLKTADARVEDLHCIYYVHEQTATMSGYTHTIRTTIFQGCYDDTEPQPILPDEGEGDGILIIIAPKVAAIVTGVLVLPPIHKMVTFMKVLIMTAKLHYPVIMQVLAPGNGLRLYCPQPQ